MTDTQVRFGQPSDRDQLARLRAALWPESSKDEHAQELELILEGRFLGVMPVVILVAQAGDGLWQDFWKPACACTPMDARHPIPSVMWKAGTSRRTGGSKGLERKCCELRRIGRAARDVSRWLQ